MPCASSPPPCPRSGPCVSCTARHPRLQFTPLPPVVATRCCGVCGAGRIPEDCPHSFLLASCSCLPACAAVVPGPTPEGLRPNRCPSPVRYAASAGPFGVYPPAGKEHLFCVCVCVLVGIEVCHLQISLWRGCALSGRWGNGHSRASALLLRRLASGPVPGLEAGSGKRPRDPGKGGLAVRVGPATCKFSLHNNVALVSCAVSISHSPS